MRRLIIQSITVLLAFLAGVGFMNYATQMGNRDMTAAMKCTDMWGPWMEAI